MTARRGDWKTTPLPEMRATLAIDRVYTAEELARIEEGLIPADMDDRWFMFHEAPWLHIHRSWTGFCVYDVRFEPSGAGFKVVEALVSRDPAQYTETDDQSDQRTLGLMLDRLARREAREGP